MRIVTAQQVAEYLATTERHVRELRSRSGLPTIKVGGLVRFDLDAIDEWLVEHTTPSRPEASRVLPTGRPRSSRGGRDRGVTRPVRLTPAAAPSSPGGSGHAS